MRTAIRGVLRSWAAASCAIAACVAFTIPAQAQITREPQTFQTSAGPVVITPIYHASALIEAGGKAIYIDPAKPADFTGLPGADLILITHAHTDHMDPGAVAALGKAGTQVWAPRAVVKIITTAKMISNGQTKQWGDWSIQAIPAYNIIHNGGHKKGEGNGYVLSYGGKRFYFSGDTEGIPEMLALKNIDVAFLCMSESTMTPREAADAVEEFRPKMVIPYHYRGADRNVFEKEQEGLSVVRILDWYPTPTPAQ